MSIDFAATVLSGLFFFGIIFGIYLYKSGKTLKISIVDRK